MSLEVEEEEGGGGCPVRVTVNEAVERKDDILPSYKFSLKGVFN